MKNSNLATFRRTLALMLIIAMSSHPAFPQQQDLGLFDDHADIGNVRLPGSAAYDPDHQVYTLTGSGTNMWYDRDEFHILWKSMRGDFILRTRAAFAGEGVDAHRKLGWIVRSSLDTSAAHAGAAVHGDGLASLQFRRRDGANTEEVRSSITAPDVLQLERKGNTYTMSVARFGEPLSSTETSEIDLGDDVYVGLFVCSHNPDVLEEAVFRNVRIIVPVKDDFVPYRDYIGGNLEILDVETGDRKVIYRSSGSMQAPNWTLDDKALIYNQDGLLYRFDLETGTPEVIDTDFATRNNNDHVLSFDGKMLGISHHSADHGGASIIYTVPVEGGTPTQVTAEGPSYLHGWSPDGRWLTYTGGRNGSYDIYQSVEYRIHPTHTSLPPYLPGTAYGI